MQQRRLAISSTTLNCQIAAILLIKLRRNQIKIRVACYWAIISLICQSLVLLFGTLLSNDVIFKFNYSDPNSRFTSVVDIITTIFYGMGKISFFFAFTYHILSIFSNENDRKTVAFLKVWMVIIGVLDLILILVVCIDDSTNNPSKETGITSTHNIYISMIDGHEGAPYAKAAMAVAILGDIIYFLVLISIYIKKLKYLHRNHKVADKKYLDVGTKGVTLITFSCIMFCIFFMTLIIDLPIKYWGAPYIVIDAVGLYLMFQINDPLYHFHQKIIQLARW